MGRHRSPYPEEFRAQMAEADRTPEQISPKFEPTAQTIINWMAPANRDAGVRQDGL
jgi:transposase